MKIIKIFKNIIIIHKCNVILFNYILRNMYLNYIKTICEEI